MPRGKESQSGSRGNQSEQGKSRRGLASASEATRKEVAKKGGEAHKGSSRGKGSSSSSR